MQRHKTYFLLLFLMTLLFFSCKKYPGPSEPVVTLESPSDTAYIQAGDTIEIKGTVSDNKSLHELYFSLGYEANDSVFFTEHPYVHGAQARKFSFAWITGASGEYNFVVEAIDHDKHDTRAEFSITVH